MFVLLSIEVAKVSVRLSNGGPRRPNDDQKLVNSNQELINR